MKGILISGIHHWGFSIRSPKVSAGGSSYPYVPISTILGALSRGYCTNYAVKDGTSCTEEFINNYKDYIFWVAYGVNEPRLLHYSDLMREERIPYRQKKYRSLTRKEKGEVIDNTREWFGVSAFGKTYGESVAFTIALIVSGKEGELSKYSWGIVSLGSKESLVTVTDVRVVEATEGNVGEFYTSFFVPAICSEELEGFEKYQLPVVNNYKLSKEPVEGVFDDFWVPVYGPLVGGKAKVSNVSGECVIFKLGDEYLVTPKEGLRRWLK